MITKSRKIMMGLGIGLALGLATACAGATIYVDRANISGTYNGKTPATAWTNLTTALPDLAASNALVRGGHTVIVATGTYAEVITVSNVHSGVPGSPNTFIANGPVTNTGSTDWTFILSGASHITVDGITFTTTGGGSGYAGGIKLQFSSPNYCSNNIIQNCSFIIGSIYFVDNWGANNVIRKCVIRSAAGTDQYSGIYQWRGGGLLTVEECTIVFNAGNGIYSESGSGTISVKNCILAGNGNAGFRQATAGNVITNANNCYFANGAGNVYIKAATNFFNTTNEINGLKAFDTKLNFSNNIVANPNFAGLGIWDFNKFYTNSPCLGAGTGGANIGCYQAPVLMDTSTNTYYVNESTGDDTRTPAAAQNSATPWRTITRASSNAIAGDTVVVAAGIYTNGAVIQANSGTEQIPVTYRANGAVTITNGIPIQFKQVSGVVMDGFRCVGIGPNCYACAGVKFSYSMGNTIRNGSCENSYSMTYTTTISANGIYVNNSPGNTIWNMRLFNNNRGIFSAGSGASTIIERCSIFSNRTDVGSGIYTDNTSVNIQNNNIFDNVSGIYAAGGNGLGARVRNCTIVGNQTNAIIAGGGKVYAVNCILANSQYGLREVSSSCYASNCCFSNSVANFVKSNTTNWNTAAEINALPGCSNNIVANPVLRNPAIFDFRLGGSPCVNAGSLTTDLATDFYGNPRKIGAACDIGSYEMPPPGAVFKFK